MMISVMITDAMIPAVINISHPDRSPVQSQTQMPCQVGSHSLRSAYSEFARKTSASSVTLQCFLLALFLFYVPHLWLRASTPKRGRSQTSQVIIFCHPLTIARSIFTLIPKGERRRTSRSARPCRSCEEGLRCGKRHVTLPFRSLSTSCRRGQLPYQ